MELLLKAVISGVVVAVASEVAKRSSTLAAVIVSLPLTSILALTWLYADTHDSGKVADLSWSILWVIVPSVVFLIALPLALRAGVSFAPAMAIAAVLTLVAYGLWIALARVLGLDV